MKTKPMKIRFLGSLALLAGAQAFAQGDHNGNGGGAHVCYEADQVTIRSVEMYDLYEGRARYHLQDLIPATVATEEEYLEYAYEQAYQHANVVMQERGREAFRARLQAAVASVNRRLRMTDAVLDPISDANKVMHARDCAYVQLANWDARTGEVHVDQSLYARMAPRDRVALKIHEALYFLDRYYNQATHSDDARESTAIIFYGARDGSGKPIPIQVQTYSRTVKYFLEIRPEWKSDRCYFYEDGVRPDLQISFPLRAPLKLKRVSGWLSGYLGNYPWKGGGWDLKTLGGLREIMSRERSFGNAYSAFSLDFDQYPILLRIKNNRCGEVQEILLEPTGPWDLLFGDFNFWISQ